MKAKRKENSDLKDLYIGRTMQGIYFCEGVKIEKGDFGDGIEKKVLQQIAQLKKFSKVEVVSLPIENSRFDKILFLIPLVNSNREKQRKVLLTYTNKVDYIYIRKPSLTIKFYRILKKIKNRNANIKILMEVPTYPFHGEYKGIARCMVLKSIFCEYKLQKVVDKIITYSDDDYIWKVPTIKISNAVDYHLIPKRHMSTLSSKEIRLTSVANFNYWHGLDRLIKGIAEYKGEYRFILNVVGEGREIPKYKKLVSELKLQHQVFFHGFKSGNELEKIFNYTDIAVDSLGRHRSGVKYNSTLKGKEYAARGIPSISGVKTEFDYMSEFPYYLRVPADDSNINMFDIELFYKKIYYNEKTISEITDFIREYTYQFFDISKNFEPVKN